MAKNLVRKEYTYSDTFVAPAGVTRIFAKLYHSNIENAFGSASGIDNDGNLFSWGINVNGQLGHGDVVPKSSPVLVLGGLKWKALSVGNQNQNPGTFFAISKDGDLYAMGSNASGELGLGDVTPRSSPVLVLGNKKWRQVFNGPAWTMGLDVDGNAWAWGINGSGQLGLGDVTPRSSPVQVLGGLKFKRITGGRFNGVGLTAAGAVYCWGGGTAGQLGDGAMTTKSSPVAVVGGLVFKQIAMGQDHVLALTEGGLAYSWGFNNLGQLGDGTLTTRSTPVPVVGGFTFKTISASSNSTGSCFAITEAGAAYSWGTNSAGQLGTGDAVARSSPVAVVGGFLFKKIWCDGNTMGLATDGKLYGWGNNSQGAAGVGDVTKRSSPVLVLGNKTWRVVDEDLVGQAEITVVPGTSYPITLIGQAIGFNLQTLSEGAILPKFVLEYYA